MAILSFPNLTPSKITWSLRANTEKFISPLNGTVQTFGRPGSRWVAVLEYALLTKAQGCDLEAFINELEGMQGRFYLHPHHHREPRERDPLSDYNTVVVESIINPRIITATGFGVGSPRKVLSRGDFFECRGELKQLTQDCTVDGFGDGLLSFTPPFRTNPSVTQPVNLIDPKCQMMLDSDENGVSVQTVVYENSIISCSEVF